MAKWKHRGRPLCPDTRAHYLAEVSEGEIDVGTWAAHLNDRYTAGYRLAHVVPQGNRTVQVFEHLHPAHRDDNADDEIADDEIAGDE